MVIKKVKALPKDQARDLLSFLEKLEQEEQAFDIQAARLALAEAETSGFIPWEKVKAASGISKRGFKNTPKH